MKRAVLALRPILVKRPAVPNLLTNLRSISTSVPAKVFHSDLTDVDLPNLTFSQMCWSRLDQFSEEVALHEFSSGHELTYSEARRAARAIGSGLLRLGAEKGDVVAMVLPNSWEHIVAFLGASEAGLVLTSLNPAYTAPEIRGQLVNSEARYVITLPSLLTKVEEAITGTEIKVILGGEVENSSNIALSSLLKDSGDLLANPPDIPTTSTCWLPYSSGTTGVPKGVMLTHRNMVSNMAQVDHPSIKLMEDKGTTVMVLPMFHVSSLNCTMSNMLWHGGKMVILPSFDPATYLAALITHRPQFLHLVPPLIGFLATHPAVTSDHLSSIATIFGGAAPVGKTLLGLLKQKAPNVRFREVYGMTEMSPFVTFTRLDTFNTEGSSGQLVPNTSMKVVSVESGEELGVGETGELCFKGPQVMPGYFKNATATAETLVDDWCHTGDIGYYDSQGRVFIEDRKKELIKVKGLQVAPAELENVLRGMDGVADVAVVGVPDQRAGELPRAYIVKKGEDLTEEQVKSYAAKVLAPHKQLAGGVEFLNEIPKSAAGKILRKDLKKAFLEAHPK